ncbi:MAG: PilZ domain-containing protein [Candidatus Omnitrophota bacterium]
MDNKRRFLRFEVDDFLRMEAVNEVMRFSDGRCFNLSLMGMCFFSQVEWQVQQGLIIDYFIPDSLDTVKLKVVVVWSELIGEQEGYLTGAEIVAMEEDKETQFINYYFHKLKERFF